MTTRSSSRRRSSRNELFSVEESCGMECGCGNYRKRFPFLALNHFASPKYALLFLCFAGIGQGFVTSGLLSVVITTLERRFHLRSTETGFISSSYDIASCLVVLLITHVGGRGHKPLWIGWGVFIMGIGSLVFTLPHFLAPPYAFGKEEQNLCLKLFSSEQCKHSNLKSYMVFFIASQLLHGIGGTTLFTLGVTYLDENVSKVQSSLYHGVYYGSGVLGPAFGFLLGGRILTIYTDLGIKVDITDASSQWVGAWWLGFLIGAIIIMLSAFPILLLPKQLPGTSHLRVGRETELHQRNKDLSNAGTSTRSKYTSIFQSIYHVVSNPTFLFLTLAGTLDTGLVVGLSTFGPKYLESMFNVTATQAATYFGLLAISAGVSGQFMGGLIVTKAKLSVKGILKFCIACSIFSICTSMIFFSSCPNVDFAGATVPYINEDDSTLSAYNHNASCNAHCACNSDVFDPVCGNDGITYYSPCFAGCTSASSDFKTFQNCSCVKSRDAEVLSGKCSNNICNSLSLFLAFFFFAILGTFLPVTPAIQAVLRVVPFSHRSLAIGVKYVFVRLLGSIPIPIIFGKVLDLACAMWSSECGNPGSCELYHNNKLASNMAYLLLALKILIMICYFLSWFLYRSSDSHAYAGLPDETANAIAEVNVRSPSMYNDTGAWMDKLVRKRSDHVTNSSVTYTSLLRTEDDESMLQ